MHTRYESRPEVSEKFRQKQPGHLHKHASYAACLADLDTGVGMLTRKLADLGLAENTLVLYQLR